MEKTLAVNAGSSSLKWQLYEMPEETVIAKGIFERIGLSGSISTTKFNNEEHVRKQEIVDHRQAVLLLMDELIHFKLIHEFPKSQELAIVLLQVGNFSKLLRLLVLRFWLRLKIFQLWLLCIILLMF